MDQAPTSPKARSRGFSFRSDKSAGSGSKNRVDLTESPQDKARRDSIWKNHSKANPNAALSEAQPSSTSIHALSFPKRLPSDIHLCLHTFNSPTMSLPQVADEPRVLTDVAVNKVLNVTEESTLTSLRDQKHCDVNGNVIGKH